MIIFRNTSAKARKKPVFTAFIHYYIPKSREISIHFFKICTLQIYAIVLIYMQQISLRRYRDADKTDISKRLLYAALYRKPCRADRVIFIYEVF